MSSEIAPIRRAFLDHHRYWSAASGLAIDQLAGSEAAIKQQYAGRVPFELLQNALDRCERRVWIIEGGDRLLVANDGKPISVEPALDHRHPPVNKTELSDFHALCSLHTSNKSPDDNTGNKGVGFRSVFSLSATAWVWSHPPGGPWWWGLVLCDPMNPEAWRSVMAHPAVRRGCEQLLQSHEYPSPEPSDRASHNFPVPLYADGTPGHFPPELENAVTVVEVPLDRARADQRVSDALDALERAHIDFVANRIGRPIEVTLIRRSGARRAWRPDRSEAGSTLATWRTTDAGLLAAARAAGLQIGSRIECAVRWPEPPVLDQPAVRYAPALYCYLPSEVPGQFGADLHGDFQLGIDRKTLDIKPAEDAGAYNGALLRRIADLHFQMVLAHLGLHPDPDGPEGTPSHEITFSGRHLRHRDDIWRFLDPGTGLADLERTADPIRRLLVARISVHLFGKSDLRQVDTWRTWASLARACFDGTPRPTHTYREFWAATLHWIQTCWPQGYNAEPRKAGLACLRALREAGATSVPITAHSGSEDHSFPAERGVVPPEPTPGGIEAGGARRADTLFQIVGDDEGDLAGVEVPRAVRERGREVTAWRFHSWFHGQSQTPHLAGTSPFRRATLLRELGQLTGRSPGSTLARRARLADDAVEARVKQLDLLTFAARLFVLPVRTVQRDLTFANDRWPPGWRALSTGKRDQMVPAGRALSTLFLPCTDGLWRPARQCHREHIAPDFLDELMSAVPELLEADALDRFLGFLGVCVWKGRLLLVEGGADGVVPPQPLPPSLVDPPTGQTTGLQVVLGVRGALGDVPCDDVPIAIDPETTRERVLDAWATWLPSFTASADQLERSDVAITLGATQWYPSGEDRARPPTGLANPPHAVAPVDVLFVARGDPRITQCTWRASPDRAEEECLRALGARNLEGVLRDPERAVALVRALATRYPDPGELERAPQVTLGLTELCNAALVSLAQHSEHGWPADLPLLTQLPDRGSRGLGMRQLAWRGPGDVWVAQDNTDKNLVKTLFPEVPLLTASLGPRQIEGTPLAGRLLSLQHEICTDVEAEIHHAPGVTAELDRVLSRLLALAHISRAHAGVVDPGDVRSRWSNTRIERAHDVWRRWWISGHPQLGTREPRRGLFNDVMGAVQRHEKRVVGSRILFDVEGEASRPPLAYFAGALAEALIDGSVEADWQAALSEVDAEPNVPFPGPRLEAWLGRRGVERPLVEHYEQQLRPLSEAQLLAHRHKVAAALHTIGLALATPEWTVLRGSLLRPEDLVGGSTVLVEDEVRDALRQVSWSGVEEPFAVDFACTADHAEQWRSWLEAHKRRIRVLRYAHDARSEQERPRDADLLRGPLAIELDDLGRRTWHRVRMSPDEVVAAWLGRAGPVDEWLPPLRGFQAVSALRAVSVAPVPLRHDRAAATEHGAYDEEGERRAAERRAAKGLGAEEVFADWVCASTAAIVETQGPEAWDALRSALHPGKRMWRLFEEAQRDGVPDLRELLHVSKRWSSAGFDVLGLELIDDRPEPVRYEVKAVGSGTGAVRVFLSLNELNVLRGTQAGNEPRFERGRWVLVGVGEDGDAVDLTPSVQPLVADEGDELASLARKGVLPDGVQVVVAVGENT